MEIKRTMVKIKVLYPKPDVRVFDENGELLSAEMAKQLLGWEEPEDGEKFNNYLFKDRYGKTIRCFNVKLQRQFFPAHCKALMSDILRGYWEYNFETIIIGKTGIVLDGKHRLIALIWAHQEWEQDSDKYDVPLISTFIGFGAAETKRLVNTIGTGKPRKLADSLFASGVFNEGMSPVKTRKLTKILDFSVRQLWFRTGAREDAYSTNVSHSDALDFIERHPNLLVCVKTIYEEDEGGLKRISRLLSTGAATGLLYLMSVSSTNSDDYHAVDFPEESNLDFKNQELAEEFWLKLARSDKSMRPLIRAIASAEQAGRTIQAERVGLIIKAWNKFKVGRPITSSSLSLKTRHDKFGTLRIIEDPTVGGVDLGRHK